MLIACVAFTPQPGRAQSQVGKDSTSRLRRYTHNIGYGVALGFVWAGVDQLKDDPEDWTYGQRLASGVGEFVIQETVTDALSWAMRLPLDYTYCHCNRTGRKIEWALQSSVTDVLPNGRRVVAVPRIVGAYAGSFAQASWRPATSRSRTQTALLNGTISLLIGGGVNLYHELRAPKREPSLADQDSGSVAATSIMPTH